jgi:CRP-like cAMP-binding protein
MLWGNAMEIKDKNLADSIAILGGLENFDSERFSKTCGWHRYQKHHQILHMNDLSTDIFFVVEGAVSARSFSAGGKEVSYLEIQAGDIFGEFSAIDGKPRSSSIETTEKSLIAQMKSDDFRQFIAEHSELGLRIAVLLVGKVRELTQRVFEFGTLSVCQRVQAELLRLCASQVKSNGSCTIDPAPTHYELATRIATHREAVSRELGNLVSLDIIKIGRKSITITDIEQLRKMVAIS